MSLNPNELNIDWQAVLHDPTLFNMSNPDLSWTSNSPRIVLMLLPRR